jgi:hypothetical protein
MNVSETILIQLGGNRFRAMTGAKNFVTSGNNLRFSLPKAVRNRINMVEIVLNASDLYDVTFYQYKKTKFEVVEVSKFENIYADQLQSLFTSETGYETKI